MTTQSQAREVRDFTANDARIQSLLEHVRPLMDLTALSALAVWDQSTAMPRGAGVVHMHQAATLQSILHDRQTDPRLGAILDELETVIASDAFNDSDRALVRETRLSYDRACKLPRPFVEETSRVRSASFNAWIEAREKNDFKIFAPWLQRTIALQRELADYYGYAETRYDALLDTYEPGLTTSRVEQLFAPVRTASTALLRRIQDSGRVVDTSSVTGTFAIAQQEELCNRILRTIGYDFNRGYLSRSEHPFTISFGSPYDVRLTTRYEEQYLPMTLMAVIHEGGHGLYEQGIAETLSRTPLAGGVSLGIHESQSRLWENLLARSHAFWQGHYSGLRETFPTQFEHVDLDTYVRALNQVQPSLIRVKADEITYNLHIMIRFEIEKELINGNVAVESLPELWNARYREYLGISASNEVDGVLQDMHWTNGFGYFPTYTLGNLYAAQITHTLRRSFPDFDARLSSGDTSFVLNWLRENIHQYGGIYRPDDLIKQATGEVLNSQYFISYITEKFGKLYGLTEA
ncbi:carboxypeptidase M32 [Dictyobacter arantiisoli]|uniref:Metal-dependent carboxypeptidase n=1 Tax=Dictyobacter arantiisoli TaxID=2014874 RepID=A0A5A5TBQ0_9CHLR|nr:carboxypeptidase M32 [Dictyobacter arantiisoli]GCF08911.1 carboxypeptidase M32 [Dictyobacter arantiisoli]